MSELQPGAKVAGLVSVIIPVHNRPRQVVEAVDSALNQSHHQIEVLVVDDGSTDETASAIVELAARDPRVRGLTQPNAGPGAARERGRRHARGEFVQYLDSDDVLLPGKLEAQVDGLRRNPGCCASYGWTRYRHADGTVHPEPWKGSGVERTHLFPELLKWRWWDTPTPLYRASACDAIGPWQSLFQEEDWEHDCRIAALGQPLHFVAAYVCEVRDHGGDRLCADGGSPRLLRDRSRAQRLILDHARRAGVPPTAPEMRHLSRALFLLSRQCGNAGLPEEARLLHRAASEASREAGTASWDLDLYGAAARVLGWQRVGRLAEALDRVRR